MYLCFAFSADRENGRHGLHAFCGELNNLGKHLPVQAPTYFLKNCTKAQPDVAQSSIQSDTEVAMHILHDPSNV